MQRKKFVQSQDLRTKKENRGRRIQKEGGIFPLGGVQDEILARVGGLPAGGGLCGGLRCPGGLVLAAVAAASGTHRTIHASRNVVHVDVGAGQTARRHRTRAGGEQRVAGRVRVSGLCIHGRNPHLLQWYTTS